MNEPAIRVENLGKRFRIGETVSYRTLRDSVLKLPGRALASFRGGGGNRTPDDVIWALEDISFSVDAGEVLGVVGANGAGKSTLLKVLSGITEPSSGRAEIRGRIGSLLEVGTGFHPELTGRENVYLNGAILGMRRHEIESRFEEIVDFSGVERFLDTPVKRFSSGMYMRLAFAVAAHLNPEILLVDEVLAVGDAAFQRKCLNKMDSVASAGRTVLFVSHNMRAISALCTRAVLLEHGRLVLDGSPMDVVKAYLQGSEEQLATPLAERPDRTGGEELRFTDVLFYSADQETPTVTPLSGDTIKIALCCDNPGQDTLDDVSLSIGFFTAEGTYLLGCRSSAVGSLFSLPPGKNTIFCHVPRWPLNGGRYIYNLKADRKGETLDWVREAGILDVEAGDYFGTGDVPMARRPGVLIDNHWSSGGENQAAIQIAPSSDAPANDQPVEG